MADGSGADPGAAVTADVGANLVAVLVILLVAVSLSGLMAAPAVETRFIPAHAAQPLSGRAQSDLLHLRLRPDPLVLVVELTSRGAFVPKDGGLRPVTELPEPWPQEAAVFVFSALHHAAFRDLATRRGLRVTEVTVPDVLRATEEAPGRSAFSEAFLAIRAGTNPSSIRPPLLRLLQSGGAKAEAALREEATPMARLGAALRQGGNLLLLVMSVAGLMVLQRRLAS